MDPSFVPYRLAASYVRQRLNEAGMVLPVVGIICGSGLSELSQALSSTSTRVTIPYRDIPGFPAHCTVPGHQGELVVGYLSSSSSSSPHDDDVPTICFRGRFHSYEGHDMKTVVLPVYVMRCLGVKVLIVTNAAGGLNPTYNVGNVICVSDHLALPQLAGKNPLIGPNDEELGPRFPATSDAYPESLRHVATTAAQELHLDFVIPHGTYCFVSGPMYESKAECRLLRSLGGDAVGMSTIPEVVAAHHCNLQILCLSLITNQVIMTGDEGRPVASHAEVLQAVAERSVQMQQLVQHIVTILQRDGLLANLPTLPPVNLQVPQQYYLPTSTTTTTTTKTSLDSNSSSTSSSSPRRSHQHHHHQPLATTATTYKLSLPSEVAIGAAMLAIGIFLGSFINA